MTHPPAESQDLNSIRVISDPESSLTGIVCIAGMHRSGTSMVARLLNLAGLSLGPDEGLAPPKDDNPDGFWENVRIVAVNDELLTAAGGAWDLPPARLPGGETVARLKADATSALQRLGDARPVGWKDPRNSLTLDFWKEHLPGLKVIVCLRNPLEVAISLNRRNFFSYELGLHLWTEYNRRILASMSHPDSLVTHYDAFFARPVDELRRVTKFIGLSCSTAHLAAVTESVRLDLRHTRFEAGDLLEARVNSDLHDLYLSLCEEASWIDSSQGNQDSSAGNRKQRQAADALDASGGRKWLDQARLRELLIRRTPSDHDDPSSPAPNAARWQSIEDRIDVHSKRLESVVDKNYRRLEDEIETVSARTNELLEWQRKAEVAVAHFTQVVSKSEIFLSEIAKLQAELAERGESVARQLDAIESARREESSASEKLQKHLSREIEERDDQIRKASRKIGDLMAQNQWLEGDRNGVLKTLEDQKQWYENDLAGLASRIKHLEAELQRLSSARVGWLGRRR